MNVFKHYSRYYDLLYRDKDYAGESDYVHRLIGEWAPGSQSILDLGCGTGAHGAEFVKKGYEVHGVDMSPTMLEMALQRKEKLQPDLAAKLSFSEGDIRTVRLDSRFDTVVSLFHVMSYQVSNDDIEKAIATAKYHLKPGGIFIFDCWYGPAVLTDRPTNRVKQIEDEHIHVKRTAEPRMRPNENVVDVDYRAVVTDKKSCMTEEIEESHSMRYLFRPELELMLKLHEFTIVSEEEWISKREPGFDTWSVCFVVR